MQETILIYAVNDQKHRKALTRALIPLKFRIKMIEAEDHAQPIGRLAGISEDELAAMNDSSPEASSGTCEIDSPFIVFCGLPQKRLEGALQRIRRAGVPVPYKAILTPSNAQWNAHELLAELKAERAAIEQGQALGSAHEQA